MPSNFILANRRNHLTEGFWSLLKRTANIPALLSVLILFSFLTLKPLWEAPGWPQNHEYDSFAKRTIIYAQHFSFNDFVPIWSSLDNNGFGSPMPLYYHKLYYFLSGLILLTTGDVKLSLILAILLFSVFGAAGVYGVGRELISSRFLASVGSLMFLSANYTVTNWLIRGALAEFSAAMLIPWALMYFIKSLKLARIQTGLAVSLGLIFLGHSVICYFLILLFGLVLMIMIFSKTTSKGILSIRTLFVPALVFTAITSPYLVVMWAFSSDYDMQRIVPPFYHPMNQFRPMWRYFWNDWIWGQTWEHLTVQLDLPVLFMIGVGVLGLIFSLSKKSVGQHDPRLPKLVPILPFIMIFTIVLMLQDSFSAFFYEYFPGAQFLQFPWRLLGVLTPVMIVMALYLLEKAFPPVLSKSISCICLMWMVVGCGAFAPIHYGRLTSLGNSLKDINFSAYGEYVPRIVSTSVPPHLDQVFSSFKGVGCLCQYVKQNSEVRRVVFHFVCERSANVPIPLFTSPYHKVTALSEKGSPINVSLQKSPSFPGFCCIDLPEGISEVQVEMPTFCTVFNAISIKLMSWSN